MAEVNLPEGWTSCTVDNLGNVQTGNTPSKSNPEFFGGDFPMFKPSDLDLNGILTKSTETLTDAGRAQARFIPRNSTYVTCIGATIGKTGFVGVDGTCNQQINTISPYEYVIPKWVYYLMISSKMQNEIKTNASSTTLPILNKSKFMQLDAVLAPLAEQKVITDKLDTLLAQVETTKARLERIPEILKSFRQSVLSAAVTGKLTEEWRSQSVVEESSEALLKRWLSERKLKFEEQQRALIKQGKIKKGKVFKEPAAPDLDTSGKPTMPDSWICVSVSEFAECLDNLRVPVKKDERQVSEGLFPYFGANGEVDRVDEYIFDDDLVMVTEDETFYGRVKPIAYRYTGKCWVNNHAHVLTAPTKEANDFLCFSLMYYKVIPWLSGTTGRAKLTQAALNTLPIALPPAKEQTEIVRRVEQLFAFADSIEQKANAALARVNNLTQSILAKAFRGELTADWRNTNPDLITGDNSAGALLAKIKAERAKLAKKTKAKA